MKKHTRILVGLMLVVLAACELAAWPAISWLEFLLPGSLISAGAVLIGDEFSGGGPARRQDLTGRHNYLARRIMRQGDDGHDSRPS